MVVWAPLVNKTMDLLIVNKTMVAWLPRVLDLPRLAYAYWPV